jgi:hypothetical protein
MAIYWLIVGTLSVWRVTHLFTAEDGPWQLMVRLRRRAGDRFIGPLLDCFYCLSLWIAAPVAWLIGEDWKEQALLWFALSGGAIFLEQTVSRSMAAPAAYREGPED